MTNPVRRHEPAANHQHAGARDWQDHRSRVFSISLHSRGEAFRTLLDDEGILARVRQRSTQASPARSTVSCQASATSRASGAPLGEVGAELVNQSGYAEMLQARRYPRGRCPVSEHPGAGGVDGRVSSASAPNATLADFLENVTLQTSADEAAGGDRVTLMTVHAAKGLEFPIVMVTGLEEQVFPFKGIDPWEDPDELEEERRLAYVAFTRAEQRLILSFAAVRRIFGQQRVGIPSRFLTELPGEDVEWIGARSSSPARPSVPEASRHDPSDSYVDYSEGSDLCNLEGLRRGLQVRHPKFGVGEVTEVMQGSPPRVSVRFPGWGTRKIIASYLEPA